MNISPKFFSLGAALAISAFIVPHASAASVSVGNASFETDGTGSTYPGPGSPNPNAPTTGDYYEEYDGAPSGDTSILGADWSVTSPSAGGWNLIEVDPTQTPTTYNNRFLTAGTSDGPTYAFLNIYGPGDTPEASTITSTAAGLSLTIQPDTTYTLTIAVGNPTSTSSGYGFGEPAPDEFIQFLANGSAINAYFPTATTAVTGITNGTFEDFTATFTTTSVDTGGLFGEALAVQMGGNATVSSSAVGIGAFDNVRLDVTAVPEPSTRALLLLGAIAFVTARWRLARGR
jgi:hypothetical protein